MILNFENGVGLFSYTNQFVVSFGRSSAAQSAAKLQLVQPVAFDNKDEEIEKISLLTVEKVKNSTDQCESV